LNPCSQLSAVKKDSKNSATRKFFGPSSFVTALEDHAHLNFSLIPKLAMVKILQVKKFIKKIVKKFVKKIVKKICQNIQKYQQMCIFVN
jgi:hypothetical protein